MEASDLRIHHRTGPGCAADCRHQDTCGQSPPHESHDTPRPLPGILRRPMEGDVSPEEVKAWLGSRRKLYFLDASSPDAWIAEADGSILRLHTDQVNSFLSGLPKDQLVVTYASKGEDPFPARGVAGALRQQGFTKVRALAAGKAGWEKLALAPAKTPGVFPSVW